MVKKSLFFMVAFTACQVFANMLVYGKTINDSMNFNTFFMSLVGTGIVLLFNKSRG